MYNKATEVSVALFVIIKKFFYFKKVFVKDMFLLYNIYVFYKNGGNRYGAIFR